MTRRFERGERQLNDRRPDDELVAGRASVHRDVRRAAVDGHERSTFVRNVRPTTTTNRRQFLRQGAAAGTGLVFAGDLSGLFVGAPAVAASGRRGAGVGPLVSDPNGLLDLPEGFSSSIISQAGDVLPDGVVLANRSDGMAAFARGLTTYLVRNHEQDTGAALPTVAAPELCTTPWPAAAPARWPSTGVTERSTTTSAWPGRTTSALADRPPGARG